MVATLALWECPRCQRTAPIYSDCPYCRSASSTSASSGTAPIDFARAAFAAGRYALCIRVLRAGPWPAAPDDARGTLRLLGLASHRQQRWIEAIDALDQWLSPDPNADDHDVRLALAESHLSIGNTKRSFDLLEIGPQSREFRRLRGRAVLAYEVDGLANVVTALEHDASEDQEDLVVGMMALEARLRLAHAHDEIEQWNLAFAICERLWEREKSVAIALRGAEIIAHTKNSEDPSIAVMLEAVAADGAHDVDWHCAWIESLVARGLSDQAATAGETALAKFPEHGPLVAMVQRAGREAWAKKRAAILAAKGKQTTSVSSADAIASATTASPVATATLVKAVGEVPAFLFDLRQKMARGGFAPTRPMPVQQREILQALCRIERANAAVTGPPGCGKSALLRAVALQLASGEDVPQMLQGYGLYEFDALAVVGRYAGTTEERITALTVFCQSNKVVLFIDNAQLLIGAGSYDNHPSDVSDALQPLMSSGNVKFVFATTDDAFQQLARNNGFERRVTRVGLGPMDLEETTGLLNWMRPTFEQHYQRVVDEAQLALAARLAEHHIRQRALPDSAIDLVERSFCRTLFDGATELTQDHILGALSQFLRVPREQVQLDHMTSLLRLEELLAKRVIGQSDAIRAVADVVRMSKAQLDLDPYRPDGVFLFVGPSGVGKTELARSLADILNPEATAFVRLDMSEFNEPHLVSRLFGAAPGYAGHEKDGQLTGALRANPSAVVLLDEIEKAHPLVYDVFLQVFDAGRLTDGRGQVVDCSRATFIMTSNIGTAELGASKIGFDRSDTRSDRARTVRTALDKGFRPEFLNRLDAIVIFDALDQDTVHRIVGQKLELLKTRFASKGIEITLDEGLIALLEQDVTPQKTGARGLMRAIEQRIAIPLTREVLANTARKNFAITIVSDQIQIA